MRKRKACLLHLLVQVDVLILKLMSGVGGGSVVGRPELNSSASPTFQTCKALFDQKSLDICEPECKMYVCACVRMQVCGV